MAVQNVNKGFVYITDFTASLIIVMQTAQTDESSTRHGIWLT